MEEKEQKLLVELLKKLEPGFLPYEIFIQIARLMALPIVELVPLRMRDGKPEVLLVSRTNDDGIWPGKVHTPGTVLRSTDVSIEEAHKRIIGDELLGLKVSEPYFVRNIFYKNDRGTEVSQIFWSEVLEDPTVGEFYPADSLPLNIINSQKPLIDLAVKKFVEFKT